MDFWEKKLRCGHARRGGGGEQRRLAGGRAVRVFAPAEEVEGNSGGRWVGEPLGGAAYTCKDRVEGNSGGWQVAGSPFTGKDRYEFEKFFAPRTVLTLSDSSLREVCGAVETIRFPLHRHAATDSRLRRRQPATLGPGHLRACGKIKGPGGPPRQRGAAGLLEGFLCPNWKEAMRQDLRLRLHEIIKGGETLICNSLASLHLVRFKILSKRRKTGN